MIQLFSVIVALFLGYYCTLFPLLISKLSKLLNIGVYLILFVMGYSFGSNSTNILAETLYVSKIVGVFSISLLILNIASINICFTQTTKKNITQTNKTVFYQAFYNLIINCKYILCIFFGIISGCIFKTNITYLEPIISACIFIILFIIGNQLKQQGISIQHALLNKHGILVSLIIITSSLFAGLILFIPLGIKLNEALALSSGFGWYTLSGILATKFFSHQIGTAAFFIDFIREIIAILLIPNCGINKPISLIGYSGATALDFSLPIIKISLGNEFIPIALTSGIILTIMAPLLITLYSIL